MAPKADSGGIDLTTGACMTDSAVVGMKDVLAFPNAPRWDWRPLGCKSFGLASRFFSGGNAGAGPSEGVCGLAGSGKFVVTEGR